MDRAPRRGTADLAPALDALPLFPLPQVVLMPGALLPLHVFEPRYRRMIRDVLDSHRALGIVQIIDAAALDRHGHPRIAEIAGAGTIVDATELPNGRFNILVRGRARVRLRELEFVAPYRRAQATVVDSTDEDVPSSAMAALISAATAFVTLVKARDASFDFRMPKLSDVETLADHCAQHLLIDGRDRQRALETTSVAERVRIVTEVLALQQLSLSGVRGIAN
ncbi:MAG: LON peptidase substrate-binding domain-containing protein [Polyangiaceae bacterium]